MAHSIGYTVTRDDEEIDVEVEYTVAPYVPESGPSWNSPGEPAEGGEIEELTVTRNGMAFILTPDETAALEAHVYDKHDYADDVRDDYDCYLADLDDRDDFRAEA
jgi:hypothetical protein